jgi:hypothetical protein
MFIKAYRLLLSERVTGKEIKYAEFLFDKFYSGVEILYGEQFTPIKVHQLVHSGEVVRNFGPLQHVSAYRFEDINGKIVGMNHATHNPTELLLDKVEQQLSLQQILHSLRDADGNLVKKDHPFMEYLEVKVGWKLGDETRLKEGWEHMEGLPKSFTYRRERIQYTDDEILDVISDANIKIEDVTPFLCFRIGKKDFQVAERAKYSNNSTWVQFDLGLDTYGGQLIAAFFTTQGFYYAVVEYAKRSFKSPSIKMYDEDSKYLALILVEHIQDSCVHVQISGSYRLSSLHARYYDIPVHFERVKPLPSIDEDYTDEEVLNALREDQTNRHVFKENKSKE